MKRSKYYHNFLVEEIDKNKVTIIHYGKDYQVVPITRVHRTFVDIQKKHTLLDFRSGLYLVENSKYPDTPEKRNDAIRRAHSRLDEQGYQASINNCEHFVTYAMTGTAYCLQNEHSGFLYKCFLNFMDCVCEYKSGLIKRVKAVGKCVSNIYKIVKDVVPTIIKYAKLGIRRGKEMCNMFKFKKLQSLYEKYIPIVLHKFKVVIVHPIRKQIHKIKDIFLKPCKISERIYAMCFTIVTKIQKYIEKIQVACFDFLMSLDIDELYSCLKNIPHVLEMILLLHDVYVYGKLWYTNVIDFRSFLKQILKRILASFFCFYLENYGLPEIILYLMPCLGCIDLSILVILVYVAMYILVPFIIDWLFVNIPKLFEKIKILFFERLVLVITNLQAWLQSHRKQLIIQAPSIVVLLKLFFKCKY